MDATPSALEIPGRGLAISGVELSVPPPTRIYLQGYTYRIQAPRLGLPSIPNVVKTIVNWVSTAGTVAKNIFYIAKGSGSDSTSDPVWLTNLANSVMGIFNSSAVNSSLTSTWSIQSITCKDAGGSSAAGTSTAAAIHGVGSPPSLPPGQAVCVSWTIPQSYRGGKPRWYIPGFPEAARANDGNAALQASYVNGLQ